MMKADLQRVRHHSLADAVYIHVPREGELTDGVRPRTRPFDPNPIIGFTLTLSR